MSDETKGYGDRHLARHLLEAEMWQELYALAEQKQQRVAELEAQLAETKRRNELLRAVVQAASSYASYHVPGGLNYTERIVSRAHLLKLTQAAIDAGLVEERP